MLFFQTSKSHTKTEDILYKVIIFLQVQIYNEKISLESVQMAQGQWTKACGNF